MSREAHCYLGYFTESILYTYRLLTNLSPAEDFNKAGIMQFRSP